MASSNNTARAIAHMPFVTYRFASFQDHFDAQLKVRDRLFAEVRFRRERQWETMKWASLTLTAVLTAITTLKTKGVALDVVTALCTGFFAGLIALGAIYRIWHDSLAATYYYDRCCDLDKAFGLYVDDRGAKLGHLLRSKARSFYHRSMRKAQYLWRVVWLGTSWAERQPVWVFLRRNRPKSPLRMNDYVKVQVGFVSSLLVLIVVMLLFSASDARPPHQSPSPSGSSGQAVTADLNPISSK